MKQWRKEIHFSKGYYVLTYLIPLMAIISFFMNEVLLFSLSVLVLLALCLNALYLQYISKMIFISGEKVTKRLFKEDNASIEIPFENKGRVPIFRIYANLFLFDADHSIHLYTTKGASQYLTNYEVPFSLSPLSRRTISMPGEALKRGNAELRTIELTISDLFLFGRMKLFYVGPFRGELVVYPTPSPIKGLKRMIQQEKGNHSQPFSLHEEMLMRGNREYSNDPFNRINWKATARTDQLQTKVFEKVTQSQWTLFLNIRSENRIHPTIENLEEVLSHVAFACHFATTNNITFELFINIRVPKSNYGLHIPAGNGKTHLTKVLETLARIRKSNLTIPTDNILPYAFKNRSIQPFILHFGAAGEAEDQAYSSCIRRGGKVIYVISEKDGAFLSSSRREYDEKMAY